MRPSEFIDPQRYPSLFEFVRDHLDMQFNDVRAMLRLPLSELRITGGCNFAASSLLCNLISGISVVLYTHNSPRRRKKAGKRWDREDRFKEVLEDFFPWDPGRPIPAGDAPPFPSHKSVPGLGLESFGLSGQPSQWLDSSSRNREASRCSRLTRRGIHPCSPASSVGSET